LKVNIETKL